MGEHNTYAVMPYSDYQETCNAIRERTGTSDLIKSGDMGNAIRAIQGGQGGNKDIPTYHYAEALRVAEKISAFKKAHTNNLVFGAISDIHVLNDDATYEAKSKTAIKNAAFALETVGAMVGADFIANLGDNCWENGIDTDNAFTGAQFSINACKPAFERLEHFSLLGNHDRSESTQKQNDLIGVWNNFDAWGFTKIRGFGYKDFADKKVRVICLNTTDYLNITGGNALSYDQKDFLLRALDLSAKSDAADWQILLLSHIPLDWNGGDYSYYADLQTILNAYEDGTTANITVNSSYAKNETPSNYATYNSGKLTYNYAGKNLAKVIANIHGHVHTNKVSKVLNTDIARIATANTNPNLNKADSYAEYGDYSISSTEAAKIVKVAGTAKDTSATFYCIDLDEQTIYAYGYGADIDRTIIYKNAVKYSVTYNLTDVTSSNTAAETVKGSSFTTTLSVGTDFALKTVTVKMGGIDITSSAYSNGVINIANVTGNIVITATAKDAYVPHWDIGDRTAVTDMYATATATKELDRKKYYYGAGRAGVVYYNRVTACSVNGNDVTFTGTEKNTGIGLPYHLEAGASYTFSAKASANGRIGKVVLNADGTNAGDALYSTNSYTSPSITFTAPADPTKWVMLIVECYTVNSSITYSDITLTKIQDGTDGSEEPTNTYSIIRNLTNVTVNNSATSVTGGSSYSTSVSADAGCALDTVTVVMGGADITSTVYSDGVISIPNVTGNIIITATAIVEEYIPHWDIGSRTAVTDLYATQSQSKALDRTKYYYGVAGDGLFDHRQITACSINGNDVTFTASIKNIGIGVPYHLESGASYTFAATSSVKGRIRAVTLDSNGAYSTAVYGSSGTSHSLTFTAPTDTSYWVVLILDEYTAATPVTYNNISLMKN